MITAEIPYAAAKDGTFPKIFGAENANGTPSVSLWITSIIMQLAMLMVYFSNNAWNTMLSITGVMVLPPYLASTAYLCKLAFEGKLDCEGGVCGGARGAAFAGVMGSAFALWLIYAAGLEYLLVSITFLALGIPFYIWARRERGQKAFGRRDGIAAICVVAVAVAALGMLACGKLGFGQDSAPAASAPKPAAKKVAPITKRHGENVIIMDEQVSEQIIF